LTFETIILAVLALALLGVLPIWPHSRDWGYWASGFIGAVLVILLAMLLTGHVPR
jgi:hypothetical protein